MHSGDHKTSSHQKLLQHSSTSIGTSHIRWVVHFIQIFTFYEEFLRKIINVWLHDALSGLLRSPVTYFLLFQLFFSEPSSGRQHRNERTDRNAPIERAFSSNPTQRPASNSNSNGPTSSRNSNSSNSGSSSSHDIFYIIPIDYEV